MISAPSISAVDSPGVRRRSCEPNVVAATSTPSWAAASAPITTDGPVNRIVTCTATALNEQEAQQDDGGVAYQLTQLQRGAQSDEEQQAEESLGHDEELSGEPPRLSDG